MFDFLLFQPFRFPQNCHLLERVSSQCVPGILYLCHRDVAQKTTELSVSSGNLRICADASERKKGQDGFGLGGTLSSPLVSLPFPFWWLPISSHSLLSEAVPPLLPPAPFFLLSGPFVSSEVWLLSLHLPQTQCHLTRASASLAFQLPPSSSAQHLRTFWPRPSLPTPAQGQMQKPLLVQPTRSGGKGKRKSSSFLCFPAQSIGKSGWNLAFCFYHFE